MTALLLQTLLLMLPAYFIGAALACGLRKMLMPVEAAAVQPPRVATAAPVEPLAQYANRDTVPVAPRVQQPVAPAAAPSVSRFDEALKTRPVEVPRPAPVAAPVAAPKIVEPARPAPPPPPAAPVVVARPAVPVAPVAAAVAAVATPVVSAISKAALPATSEMISGAAAAAAAAASAVALQARSAAAAVAPVVAPVPVAEVKAAVAEKIVIAAPAAVAAPAAASTGAADDLTRISVIDSALNGQLAKLGVTRFQQIASWHKPEVAAMSQSLGFQGRIEQENWIEQAQILAGGGETYYSSRRGRATGDVPAATATVAPAAAIASSASTQSTSSPSVSDRSAFAGAPASQRDMPVAAPAATAPAAVSPLAQVSTAAAIAAAAVSAAAVSVSAPKPAEVEKVAATAELDAATAVRPPMAPTRDNLQRIGAINSEIERLLGAQGITRFSHIAGWGSPEIDKFDRLLGSQGRIARENWVEQAQILAKGGDTAHSREFDRRNSQVARDAGARPKSITDAIRANGGGVPTVSRPDISGLRSVRSDAYRAPAMDATTAATAAAAASAASVGSAKVVRSAEIDDLKRIRGIGVLIEKRLNSVGIVSYSQIADWTTEDIDRVSASLDFKGRIERENWVEQARILSAGGQTEFSRRVDRGEVETSKMKPG